MNPFWLFLCATQPEWGKLKKKIRLWQDHTYHHLHIYEGHLAGQKIRLGQIGLGPERAQRYIHSFLSSTPQLPNGVIHFGLSGALTEDLKCGDLVVPHEIMNQKGEKISISSPLFSGNHSGLPLHHFPLLTVDHLLETPDQKREAGQKWGTAIVDMESYPIAKYCQEKGIPYFSIRAVWDPLEWDLKLLNSVRLIRDDGEINRVQILKGIITKPKFLFELPKYQKAMKRGNKAITAFLMAFFRFYSNQRDKNSPKPRVTSSNTPSR